MKIIPVLDYMDGRVVLAQGGQRASYQAVGKDNSSLVSDHSIQAVIDGYLTLYPFKNMYIADLDCIGGQGLDIPFWSETLNAYPTIEFWLDLGLEVKSWAELAQQCPLIRPIVGTELFKSLSDLQQVLSQLQAYRPILSIDMKHDQILGVTDILEIREDWPEEVILLSLERVGTANGPKFEQLAALSRDSRLTLYSGGGTRHSKDIVALAEAGAEGVLLAKALHDGSIGKDDIERFNR
ncbi:HisA/HisF-related TIM barrel protein [Gammaproteobacteria bacterium]|nr:HisA/HisF-related TIM barrel protein [Gammaproteobacteria bacterium]MDC1284457.1 HisA/HisF-related TIM barrel protein [Gammaproteobacteria bacterium]